MYETIALSTLAEGQSGYVTEIKTLPGLRRRLMDLGMVRGTRVTCLYRSPAGDPAAYLIRGAVIALRGADAGLVQVERAARPVPDTCPAVLA